MSLSLGDRILVAQWALGLWLRSYDKWIVMRGRQRSHRILRSAALVSRARGLIAHDRMLNEQVWRYGYIADEMNKKESAE